SETRSAFHQRARFCGDRYEIKLAANSCVALCSSKNVASFSRARARGQGFEKMESGKPERFQHSSAAPPQKASREQRGVRFVTACRKLKVKAEPTLHLTNKPPTRSS